MNTQTRHEFIVNKIQEIEIEEGKVDFTAFYFEFWEAVKKFCVDNNTSPPTNFEETCKQVLPDFEVVPNIKNAREGFEYLSNFVATNLKLYSSSEFSSVEILHSTPKRDITLVTMHFKLLIHIGLF